VGPLNQSRYGRWLARPASIEGADHVSPSRFYPTFIFVWERSFYAVRRRESKRPNANGEIAVKPGGFGRTRVGNIVSPLPSGAFAIRQTGWIPGR